LNRVPGTYLRAVREPGQSVNPLFAFLGVAVREITRDLAVLELPFRPELVQGGGVTAGGVVATLADEAMAHVVLANLDPGEHTATIEMSTRYFRPALSRALTATATLVNRGRRVMSAEASVTDEDGRLVAKASASFFRLRPDDAGNAEPARETR
jgi:uncharacterized protein (TIGR00369 family)